MQKIKTVTLTPTSYDSKRNWKETVHEIETVTNNYDLDTMCENCIKRQHAYGVVDPATGKPKQTITCTGITTFKKTLELKLGQKVSDEFYTELLGKVGKEALQVSEEVDNSYEWMTNTMVDPSVFNPRPHQRMINSCLSGDTKVSMADGSYKDIRDISIGDVVVSYHQAKKKFRESVVTNTFNQGIKDVYKIVLENRDTLICTEDHPILSWWKSGKTNPKVKPPSFKLAYVSIKDGLSVGTDVFTMRSSLGESLKNTTKTAIVSIEKLDKREVFDIEVEKDHNFVANNIVVHNCSATMKVLRMGRRCLSGDSIVVGNMKNYSVKHLYHLLKYDKKRPFIQAFDDVKMEMVYTDQYVILPNTDTTVYSFTLEDGFTVDVTSKHPLLVYKDKHYHFEEAYRISVGDLIIRPDSQTKRIVNITVKENIKTYHMSVLKYHTFVTKGGFIHHNTGKALDVRTPIPTPDGWKTMGDLEVGDKVFDDEGNECNVTFVTEFQNERECFEITFDNGDTIIADADHQWAVSTRSKRRDAISNGQEVSDIEDVLQTKDLLDFKTKHYAIRLTDAVKYSEKDLEVNPYVLGYWLGDGNSNTTILTIGDEDKEETLARLMSYGVSFKHYKQKYTYKMENMLESFKALNVLHNKHIPTHYLQSSVEQRLELLRGLLDSDGSYSKRDGTIEYSSSDEKLANDVKELVSSLGIKTSIRKSRSIYNGKVCKDRYRLVFKTHLKVFNLLRKDQNTKEKSNSRSAYLYIKSIVPVESRPVKCISVDSPRSLYLATKNYIVTHNTFSMAVGMLHRLLTRKNYEVLMVAPMVTMINEVVEQLKKFCDELPINPITRASATPINLIEFNTGSTFKGVPAGASGAKGARGKSADLLYMDECLERFTKIRMSDNSTKAIEDIEVGDYVCSFDENTGKLVNKKVIGARCTGHKDIFEYKTVSGQKIKATPNHPVWTREGWVEIDKAKNIATLNTKTGLYFFEGIVKKTPKGVSKVYNLEVEGTHTFIANNFITHNCDFLSVKDLNSLLAIKNDNPNVEIWASSTPIGEGNLYKLGSDPAFKEFHFPTHIVAHYSDDIDAFNRRNLTDIAYEQEVLANYGASEDSVFPVKFVEQATYDREVLEENGTDITLEKVRANRRNFIIVMGVDWNRDKVGTRIIILAYDKSTRRYHILNKDSVAKMGWTQILAIEKIVDNNALYDVDHIYVDDGNGETQASILRAFGQQRLLEEGPHHPDAKLMYTKSVMFGSSLTFRDPVSNEEIKRQTKQFMVDHTVNLLSRGNLVLLKEEDNDIVMQMKNYNVKSVSVKGLKTYKARDTQIGDHDLDAYMLALHALHQEYSELAGHSPINSLVSLLKGQNVPKPIDPDPYQVIGSTTNIILNTRKSLTDNAFRRSSNTSFRTRKRIR